MKEAKGRRDMSIVRLILESGEKHAVVAVDVLLASSEKRTEIRHHVEILADEGFVRLLSRQRQDGDYPRLCYRLTWKGHNLLDELRSDSGPKGPLGFYLSSN